MNGRIDIAAIGVLAPGMDGWDAARRVLSGATQFDAHDVAPKASSRLGAAERRRLNTNARWALAVAGEALDAAPEVAREALACVFGSTDGDGDVLAQTLAALVAAPVVMSPTLFHNSVFNAPAGYCSIAYGLTGASTSLCAGEWTFAAALVDACDQVLADGIPVLCVVVDAAYPPALAGMRASVASFACALLLRPVTASASSSLGSISIGGDVPASSTVARAPPAWLDHWSEDTAAAALPLLAAIATRLPTRLTLPQPADERLVVHYHP
ncbi:MAG: beta-ketoacyl synthase chain length factor [Betaproteobacteria bacterium]